MSQLPEDQILQSMLTQNTENKHSLFTLTISDSYCTYSYPFLLNNNLSIADIAKRVADAFQTDVPKGNLLET